MRRYQGLAQLLWLCLLTLALTSCGSRLGELGEPCSVAADCSQSNAELVCRARVCSKPLPPNKAPTAVILYSPTVPNTGEPVDLDGRRSSDPEGDLLTYKWTLAAIPDGSKAAIGDNTARQTTFTPDLAGEYTIQLVVSDDKNTSEPREVKITVQDGPNAKPVAKAGDDVLVPPGQKVDLDGSGSSDADGDAITYLWRVSSRPPNSSAQIEQEREVKASFTPDKEGRYILELIVTDRRGLESDPDTLTINVQEGADKTPALSSVSPAEGFSGSRVEVVLKGSDFVEGAEVRLQNQYFPTQFVSATELKATINLSSQTAGDKELYIKNPNNRFSKPAIPFKVKEVPAPVITSLNPPQGFENAKMTFRMKGQYFIAGQVEVTYNFKPVDPPATVISDTELEFTIDFAGDGQGEGIIKVRNTTVNKSSADFSLKIGPRPPKPSVEVVVPISIRDRNPVEFNVYGKSFEVGATIYLELPDGTTVPIPTKRVGRTNVQADPRLDLSDETKFPFGDYKVFVKNPDGQQSDDRLPFSFTGANSPPKLDRILPFIWYLGEKLEGARVFGGNFEQASGANAGTKLKIGNIEITQAGGPYGKLIWEYSDAAMTLDLDLTDESKWTQGDLDAVVINDNGKASPAFKVTITYRQPSVSSVTPSGASTTCDQYVCINGINFTASSYITVGAKTYKQSDPTNPAKLESDRKLCFTVKKGDLAKGKFDLYVHNGPNAKSGKADFNVSDTIVKPVINYIRPATGRADTLVTVEVYPASTPSRSFTTAAAVYVDGKLMATACDPYTGTLYDPYCYDLTAEIDLAGFKAGTYSMWVANACDTRSDAISFIVGNPPKPAIFSVEPPYAKVGDKLDLVFKGRDFTANHSLYIDGVKVDSTFVSKEEIKTKNLYDFTGKPLGDIDIKIVNSNSEETPVLKFSVVSSFVPLITKIEKNVQQRGRVLPDLIIKGSNFVLTSVLFVNGKASATQYVTTSELRLIGFDATQLAAGTYAVEVRNGSRSSNKYPIVLEPIPPPTADYLRPSNVVAGSVSKVTSLYVYGTLLSATPPSIVIIKDPKGVDISSRFTPAYTGTTYIRGDFDIVGLPPGKYTFQIRNPTGETSNPLIFTINPPPPPTAYALSPPFAFRGNSTQILQITGANFITGDFVIFNNNTTLPGRVTSATTIEATVDLSAYRFAKTVDVFVQRCLDPPACTQLEKTTPLQLEIRNPSCTGAFAVDCTKLIFANTEKCDTAGENVCRPACTKNSDCTGFDASASWTCQSGFCK
ncbi:MAG: PKD domain-containing protein [Myxococcales bacterium]|nr:PKD domain-containing protein [Myxococcales bacterium]